MPNDCSAATSSNSFASRPSRERQGGMRYPKSRARPDRGARQTDGVCSCRSWEKGFDHGTRA